MYYLRDVLYEFFSRECLPSSALSVLPSTQYILTPNPKSAVTDFVTSSPIESTSIQLGMGFTFWMMAAIVLIFFF